MVLHVFTSFLRGSIVYSLWIVQWDFTRWDHLENPGRVSGSGLVNEDGGRHPSSFAAKKTLLSNWSCLDRCVER